MDQKDKDLCVSYLLRVIDDVRKGKYYRMQMTQHRPLKVGDDGTIVRDTSKLQTLDLHFAVKD